MRRRIDEPTIGLTFHFHFFITIGLTFNFHFFITIGLTFYFHCFITISLTFHFHFFNTIGLTFHFFISVGLMKFFFHRLQKSHLLGEQHSCLLGCPYKWIHLSTPCFDFFSTFDGQITYLFTLSLFDLGVCIGSSIGPHLPCILC